MEVCLVCLVPLWCRETVEDLLVEHTDVLEVGGHRRLEGEVTQLALLALLSWQGESKTQSDVQTFNGNLSSSSLWKWKTLR